MPTNYTPLSDGQDAIAATFNAPLTQLDTAIENIGTGSKALASPTITSYANAQHTHQNAAGGGKLTASAIDSGLAANGHVLTANGSGAAAWQGFNGVPTGVIVPYGGSSAPTGWLLCDGTAINRVTFAALFAVVGISFGVGDSSTTFNLPDLRGRFPLGKDDMGGSSANQVTAAAADTVGQGAGAENITLDITQIPAHTHAFNVYDGGGGGSNTTPSTASQVTAHTATTASTGGGLSHSNMPPYQTVNYIVKA